MGPPVREPRAEATGCRALSGGGSIQSFFGGLLLDRRVDFGACCAAVSELSGAALAFSGRLRAHGHW
jgi:hypothetical protein